MKKSSKIILGGVIGIAIVAGAVTGVILLNQSKPTNEEEVVVPPNVDEDAREEKVYLNILEELEPGGQIILELDKDELAVTEKQFSSAVDNAGNLEESETRHYQAKLSFDALEKTWMILRKYNVYFHFDQNPDYAFYFSSEDSTDREKLTTFEQYDPLQGLARALASYAAGGSTDAELIEWLDAIITEQMINL